MSVKDRIENVLTEHFRPTYLEVVDESRFHAGHAGAGGGGGHFSVTIVSEMFEGRSLVERHRMVYQLLADEMKQTIHALALNTRTPAEWAQAKQK